MVSTAPVRYFDGVVQLSWTDLSSDGFGDTWGQTRSWSNGGYNPSDGTRPLSFNGNGMVDENLPYMTGHHGGGGTIYVITSATNAYIFNQVGDGYVPAFFFKDQLIHANREYIFTDTAGDQFHFYDFSYAPSDPRWGKFKSMTDPYGNVTAVTSWTADGQPAEVQRRTPLGQTRTLVESYLYTYVASGPNVGLISQVTQRRQVDGGDWSVVRQVVYKYYNGTEPFGNATDLKTATIEDTAGNALDTTYYRYYTPGDIHDGQGNTIGYVHGLKYVFDPQSFARLAAVGDPFGATDAEVAPYADNSFEYNDQHQATKEVAQGTGASSGSTSGQGTFTFSYAASRFGTGFNIWRVQTTETLPDNNPNFVSRNIVYTNGYGEIMLKVYKSGPPDHMQQWDTFYQYDNSGRIIKQANPSAVSGYDDSQSNLNVSLNANSGLITTTDYYPDPHVPAATETTAGGVDGYFEDTKIQQGRNGTPILQSSQQYLKRGGSTFDVQVATGSPSVPSAVDRFTYVDATPAQPVVSGLSVLTGSVLGGEAVPITGTGFTGASAVKFGGTPAISYTVLSDTTIIARAPGHAAGTVDVTVTTPGGTSANTTADQFTFVAPPVPVLASLDQTTGTIFGGATLTISGTSLTAASRVTFGTSPAAFTVRSDNAITVQVPAHVAGTVDIQVITPGGTTARTAADQFTYVLPLAPTVTGLSLTSGSVVGGDLVTISGLSFTGTTAVWFGSSRTSFTVNSDTSITARVPARAAATVVDVTVTTPGGTSAITDADRFSYVLPPAPVIIGLTPPNGLVDGGTNVTIVGSNLAGATAVTFGDTPAASFTIDAPTQITAHTRAHAAGVVDVTVTTPGGTSAITAGDRFTYLTNLVSDPPQPVVAGLSPAAGGTMGGTVVTIVGTGFLGPRAVTFGGIRANLVTVVSPDIITAQAPALPPGPVDVQVTNLQGTSDLTAVDQFTAVAPPVPVVTGLSQAAGNIFGGVVLTVFGNGLSGATRVTVGGTQVSSVKVLSDTAVIFRVPGHAAGMADVLVTTPGGTSAVTPADVYTYNLPAAPVVTGLSLTRGSIVGGVTLLIMGTGFNRATKVDFGSAPAPRFTVVSDTAISVAVPAQDVGTVDVTVTTPGGTSATVPADQFTYVMPPIPVVTVVAPASGSAVGGTSVTILGSGLSGATQVDFGGMPATSVTVHSDGEIVAQAPPEAAGVVDITVTTPGGTSAITAADQYTYITPAAPVVTGLSPTLGPTQGGDTITLIGRGFTGASTVTFGDTPATHVTVISDQALSACIPAHAPGLVDVTVTTPGGTSAITTADRYTYIIPAVPVVTGVGPTEGLTTGGGTVTIIGHGFTGATAVAFGTAMAPSVTVLSDSALFVQLPAQDPGTVDVTVTGPSGTSIITPADQFTYVTHLGSNGPKPVVSGVGPTRSAAGGGSLVTIIGTGFSRATAVNFGNIRVTSFVVLSDSAISVRAPAHPEGVTDVTVMTTPTIISDVTPADQFNYTASQGPVVTGLSVPSGPTAGGYSITVIGSGFTGATDVTFGGTPASYFQVLSDHALTVVVPFHALVAFYPVANKTVYRNTDGTGAETTQYASTWFPGTAREQSETITKPVISATQNGPGTPDVETTVYNSYGMPIWTKDGDGFINYTAYDTGTGAVVKTITDVDTTRTSDFQDLPAGWVTPPSGGLHLETQFGVDLLGREIQRTDPNGNITYTVYDDPDHEQRVYPGWNPDTNMPTGPTQVTREDRDHSPSYVETLTMSARPNVDANGQPDGTEPISDVQSLTRTFTSPGGQVIEKDAYFSLDGVDYTTDPYLGQVGVNYYATMYGYDAHGRPNRFVAPTGTITQTDYDGLGRVVDVMVGTSDANLVMVSQNQYDNGGVGDGNLTQVTQFPGGGAAPRVTQNFYDWRDRLVASKQGVQASENDGTHRPVFYTQHDNLNEVVSSERYDGDGVNITTTNGVPDRPAANRLRAKTTTVYDDQGRVFQTNTFSVDQNNGTVSTNSLTTGTWYDHRGNVLKIVQPGGPVTKYRYNGAGLKVAEYITDGLGDVTWADAGTVANNNVLSETDTQYDGDGNPILVVQRERFHDETMHGALGDANSTDHGKARASYVASYYDPANRLTDQVNVGTNGGMPYVRPDTVPDRSDTVLVTHTDYNPGGLPQDVTDPRGIVTRTLYDLLGRTTETIEDYTDGTPTDNSNRTTAYTYDGDGHVLTLTAVLPEGMTQTTQYVYGVTGVIHSNDLLAATIYPDNGQPNTENYTYNALGELATKADRNGTTHTYRYDVLGRQTVDAVTTLGDGVDGSVQRLETTYDTGGRPYLYTSYDAASGGHIVNQVEQVYNGLGQLITEYQAHAGAVNPATTPKVQYAYSEMAGGANHSRLISMTYPDGRVIHSNYAAGVDDAVSRLTSLLDSSGVLESYRYLGLDTVVERAHPQNGVNLTYISPTGDTGDAGDPYTGLDRFGRVVDQLWLNTATGQATDEFTYGYDADGNPLYRDNLVDTAFGELYQANGAGYDGLNRLTDFARGTLNATHDGLIGPASRSQDWSLDALGNWQSVTSDGTPQSRDHNAQNQITDNDGAPLTYDNNGNTTTDDNGNSLVYDAWNRLVQVTVAATGNVITYGCDAQNRRITTATNGGMPTDLYYSSAWQVVEEQVGGVMQAQYVWSPVYVDALVERDTADGTRLYVQQDANWDVTAIVDATGTVQERYIYDPYGQAAVLAPGWTVRVSSLFNWIYLHQGSRYDRATGLYDFRFREYSPTLGRWMQQDPLGYTAGDLNLYGFVGNRPNSTVDPTGQSPVVVVCRAIFLILLFLHGEYQGYIELWIKIPCSPQKKPPCSNKSTNPPTTGNSPSDNQPSIGPITPGGGDNDSTPPDENHRHERDIETPDPERGRSGKGGNGRGRGSNEPNPKDPPYVPPLPRFRENLPRLPRAE
jgi:RHS repeat-associated protein